MPSLPGVWEYKVVAIAASVIDEQVLNSLGLDRWELVLLRTNSETDQLVFKREKK